MLRRLVLLCMLLALAVPGFARAAWLVCEVDGQVHLTCCCGDGFDEDGCCEVLEEEDHESTAPAVDPGPDARLAEVSTVDAPAWPSPVLRPASSARYIRGPPPLGPPIFLRLRSLLR